jgi:tRNA-Thr(GGU) m(6)t(6)A37 methyltransferase TsaA
VIQLRPIGVIHSPFTEAEGTPIQTRFAGDTEGSVEVFEEFVPGLRDLDGFERIWLIYWFDRSRPFKLMVKPYLDTTERGLFATRAPSRPNPIGISCVKLLEMQGNILRIAGVDILDGTPLLDIKPYVAEFDSFGNTRSGWLDIVKDPKKKADNRFHKS